MAFGARCSRSAAELGDPNEYSSCPLKALFLSQRVPYPPDRGDKISSWRIVERLSREHEVTIIAFSHDEADEAGAEALRAKGFEVVTIAHDENAKKISTIGNSRTATSLDVFKRRISLIHTRSVKL